MRGTGILGQLASFERRLRGGGSNAPRPAVSVPNLDVKADGCRARQVRRCKILRIEEEFLRFWLYLDVCSVWIIPKISIISKR